MAHRDVLGNELKVGDRVAYAWQPPDDFVNITIRTVERIDPKGGLYLNGSYCREIKFCNILKLEN